MSFLTQSHQVFFSGVLSVS